MAHKLHQFSDRAQCPGRVMRDRLEPAASPAMSAVPPKAEEVRYGATCQRTMGPTRLATIASCAGVSVFQSRRAIDRRQPRRAILSCSAGFRIRDGHRLSRRAPAAFYIIGFALVVIGVFVASRKPANAR